MSNLFRKEIIDKNLIKKQIGRVLNQREGKKNNILPFNSSKKMVRESQVPYIMIYSPFIKILSINNLIKK